MVKVPLMAFITVPAMTGGANVQQSVKKGLKKSRLHTKLHEIAQQIFNTLYQILK